MSRTKRKLPNTRRCRRKPKTSSTIRNISASIELYQARPRDKVKRSKYPSVRDSKVISAFNEVYEVTK